MITSVAILEKIKSMSGDRLGHHPRILLADIAAGLPITSNDLLVLLAELENRGTIIIHKTGVASVSLTSYGLPEEYPDGGLNSEQ